jgi:hypothetical protein
MRNSFFFITIFITIFILLPDSYAQVKNECCCGRDTYGNYCEGPKQGRYGARKIVRKKDGAREILKACFSQHKDLKIGEIKERELFFEAEIKDENNTLVDKVIVDKRTGRIRSIY